MTLGTIFCCARGFDWEQKREKKGACRIFSLKELLAATNNFNYDNLLGEGGIGSVYWGQLSDGSQIAVKRLKVFNDKAEMEFSVEIEILTQVHHKNLLSINGYCAEGQERLIVYDYMPNLSLQSQLHGHYTAECVLDWKRRMNIAIGSAEGIVYLHHCANPHIIHRDIKASNVLLDSDFQAKVADFQLAKLIPEHVTSNIKGTIEYLAPEYIMLGQASESCDVFSFGILLLELASGRRAVQKRNPTTTRFIVDWALPLAHEGKFSELADPKLNGNFVEEELRRMILVGLKCAQVQPEKRPTMLEVVKLLKEESKDKLSDLQNKLFRDWRSTVDKDQISQDSAETLSVVDEKLEPPGSDLAR